MAQKVILALFVTFTINMNTVHAHGRLLDPPSRMSAWRLGFPVPKNYLDHGMNCGGRDVQWAKNKGKCGICGDSWSGTRFYERPNGAFVQHNIITKTYRESATIQVTVEITAPHNGWSEFRICDIARSGGVEANQSCLNKTVLVDKSNSARFHLTSSKRGLQNFTLVLPQGFTCDHCLLQWKWKTGNSWGCDTTGCGLGKGNAQEEFYGCSDVKIIPRDFQLPVTTPRSSQKPPTVRPTRYVRPTGKDFTGYSFLQIIRMFNIVSRTFDLTPEDGDDDLNLDDLIPLSISGQDYLQIIFNLRNQAKLNFIP